MTKLKCYELCKMLGGDSHGFINGLAYVFKSGKDVKIRFFTDFIDEKKEQKTLDFLRSKGLKCIPDTIPTDGYYTVEW